MKATYINYFSDQDIPLSEETIQNLNDHYWQTKVGPRAYTPSEFDCASVFSASKEFETLGEAMREFELLTGINLVKETAPDELGGSFFEWGDKTTSYGNGCARHLALDLQVRELMEGANEKIVGSLKPEEIKLAMHQSQKTIKLSRASAGHITGRPTDHPLAG